LLKYTKGKRKLVINLCNDETTVTSQLMKSTLCSAEYIIDVPKYSVRTKNQPRMHGMTSCW